MIKYLGSKRTLLPAILRAVRAVAPPDAPNPSVLDLFSGTSRVGHALKRAGHRVIANDHNAYAYTLARCYVQADREDILPDAESLIAEFNRLPGRPGYFTDTFCARSRFFHPRNGERIDAIRDRIEALDLPPDLRAVMLISLMEAADRVDSTTGVQMAYLKSWAPRAMGDLELRLPDVLPRAAGGKGEAHDLDALDAAARLEADVAYIDPPYNQHSYLGNYHIWETLVRWDAPPVYGVACKREDCRARTSPFNSRRACAEALSRLFEITRARALVVSINDEGFLSREQVEAMLARRGRITTLAHDYKRYVGAQIGIYNPQGRKVGRVGRLRNTEFLCLVTPHNAPDPAAVLGQSPALETR
ncbi:MAG: DNA adenine methylase [Phycisphaerales bacterium]|nr:DNA adenine methylase [Phycisphaerales bacterium]